MADKSRSQTRVTCPCGKTVQARNLSQHCSSRHHTAFALRQQQQQLSETEEKNSCSTDDVANECSDDVMLDLSSYLRENDLRTNQARIRGIVDRYQNTDPYTKVKLDMENGEEIQLNFDVDHIHEVQILAYAIHHTPELVPRISNVLILKPLRKVLNDISNLAITEASVNRSKGQAVRYFLSHFEVNTDLPLLSAFIQTAVGKERKIAQFARNIADLMEETSSTMSESIRQARMENGHVAGAHAYETVAEQFDTIIDRMKLDWNEGVKLRNGKTYYAYK